MDNFIVINDRKIDLTEDQVEQLVAALDIRNVQPMQLAEFAAGDTVKIGEFEMVVLEQLDGETALVLKGMYGNDVQFSQENNNFNSSIADAQCQKFAQELSETVGWMNIVLHTVDLTSDDGLKDYGTIQSRCSLLTADLYRRYVEILDKFKPDDWWWLATPWSTKRHNNDSWVKCVSPSGRINSRDYNGDGGVRPFCILKSTIFVSK